MGRVGQLGWGPVAAVRNMLARWAPAPKATQLAAVYAPAEPLAAALARAPGAGGNS